MGGSTPKPKMEGWVEIKVKIPREWKEALEDIKRRQLYESLSDVVRHILREYLLERYWKTKE